MFEHFLFQYLTRVCNGFPKHTSLLSKLYAQTDAPLLIRLKKRPLLVRVLRPKMGQAKSSIL
jgi:hypothetical protein